ncbi:unnamed protein product [Clavelina lepadiformis]|uniref:Uncharacterized protein n=1 Tax=Clavelina lepadiformis TaxID=159417 RepID=A0ABP0FZA8_CLALP
MVKTVFFGAKTHHAQMRIEQAPSPAACAEWARTKHAAGCGPLATTDGITWTTSTRNVITYKWPTESSNTVYNVILIKSLAIYDHARGKMSSPIGSMSSCKITQGSCVSGTSCYIWDYIRSKINCRYKRIGHDNETLLMHFNESNDLFRLEIKSLGVSIHKRVTCPIPALCSLVKSSAIYLDVQHAQFEFVHKDVRFVDNYIPEKTVTFVIDGTFYVYDNYTLTRRHNDPHSITSSLVNVKAPMFTLNFSSFINLFPGNIDGHDDLSGILEAVSQPRLIRSDVSSLAPFIVSFDLLLRSPAPSAKTFLRHVPVSGGELCDNQTT